MPKSVTEVFSLDPGEFAKTGAFDAILDFDTKLFIDPHLLLTAQTPELIGSYETFRTHFSNLLKVLKTSQGKDDVFWRQSKEMLIFPEIEGLCIGYGKHGTAGSGIGPELRDRLIQTAKQIVDAGIQDPVIFELVGLLEEDIGSDRISDMTGRIISPHLVAFTDRVFSSFKINKAQNPFNGLPVILVPGEVLRPLPVAHDWSDIDIVASENEALRKKVNEIVGGTWKHATRSVTKRLLKDTLVKNPELIRDLIAQYKAKPTTPYDFAGDPSDVTAWHAKALELANECQLDPNLTLPAKPTQEDVLRIVRAICTRFKEAIEYHDHARDLYRDNGNPRHESFAQRLFRTVADAYCEANNLDLSRESNAGRGPVDFKVSGGYNARVLVELKLSNNTDLVHGFQVQIEEYRKAEKPFHAIYMVIDVGNPGQWRERLAKANNEARGRDEKTAEIFDVDGRIKKSASKM